MSPTAQTQAPDPQAGVHKASALLDEVMALTENMLESTRTLDGARLTALATQRAVAIDAFRASMTPRHYVFLAPRLKQLMQLEQRLTVLGESVIAAIDDTLEDRPVRTYARNGRVGG